MTDKDEIREAFLNLYGIDHTETVRKQMDIFMEALQVFVDRNALYKDNWKRGGWIRSLVHIDHKASRLWSALGNRSAEELPVEEEMDEAIDLMNYAAFFIRNTRGEGTQ